MSTKLPSIDLLLRIAGFSQDDAVLKEPENTFPKVVEKKDDNQVHKQRCTFSEEDDKKLASLVSMYGKNWPLIAERMKCFTSRQCRERYKNYLDPDIVKTPWSRDEDQKLLELYQKFGPRWREISKYLNGRSYNQVRNHFVSLQKSIDKFILRNI